jgi:NTE family protein
VGIRRGLVLGCGGTVGGAWTVGALAVVAHDLGWDPRDAEVIVGTSSGSSIAAMLGAGFGVEELLAAQRDEPSAPAAARAFFTRPPRDRPPVPRPGVTSLALAAHGARHRAPLAAAAGLAPVGTGRPAFLDPLADHLAAGSGWVTHPATWLVGVDLGRARRVAFGAPGAPTVPLRHALHASWAIPGWYRPMRAHGRRYADGGILSPASADLIAPLQLDEVVLIAPMVSVGPVDPHGLGRRLESVGLRRGMTRIVDREVAGIERAGTRVLRIHPGAADLEAMGPNFMDPRRRLAGLAAALATGPASLNRIAARR